MVVAPSKFAGIFIAVTIANHREAALFMSAAVVFRKTFVVQGPL